MATYLDRIIAFHRRRAEADDRPLNDLRDAAAASLRPRGFAAAIAGTPGLAVIAEIKRRSPSKGPLAADLDPGEVAVEYAKGKATCLSVLTDAEYFGGSAADLAAARKAVELPILRKDFTVCEADVYDARIMGADAVLLIVAALSAGELEHLSAVASEVDLDALVEVHDEAEAEMAVAAGAKLIGVNQRDLVTFQVDTERAIRVSSALPTTAIRVAESGIGGPADAERLCAAGFDAVLVGESVVTAADRSNAVRALSSVEAPARTV